MTLAGWAYMALVFVLVLGGRYSARPLCGADPHG